MAMLSDVRTPQSPSSVIPPTASTANDDDDDSGRSENYEALNLVGAGAYGTVYRARDLREPGCYVALKKVRMRLTDEGVPLNALREIAVLRQIDKFEHPNIVRLLDVCVAHYSHKDHETTLTFVFEFMDMDLSQYIRRCPPPGLPPCSIKDFMHQMLKGVDFLHTNKVIHRDLKPQNILISSRGTLKLADMGLARIYTFSMLLTATVVTLWYRAPEVLMQSTYSSPIDLWSIGCMFAEMLNKKPLFAGQSEITQLQKIFDVIGLPQELDWPRNISLPRSAFAFTPKRSFQEMIQELENSVASDLLEQLLSFNQYERVTASAALEHPYFKTNRRPRNSGDSGECMTSSPPKRKPSASDFPDIFHTTQNDYS